MAGLVLSDIDGLTYVTDILPGTPCAKIPQWRTRMRNTCIREVNGFPVSSSSDVMAALASLPTTPRGRCTLVLSSPELRDGLTNEGIPQVILDQLNPRHFFGWEVQGGLSSLPPL